VCLCVYVSVCLHSVSVHVSPIMSLPLCVCVWLTLCLPLWGLCDNRKMKCRSHYRDLPGLSDFSSFERARGHPVHAIRKVAPASDIFHFCCCISHQVLSNKQSHIVETMWWAFIYQIVLLILAGPSRKLWTATGQGLLDMLLVLLGPADESGIFPIEMIEIHESKQERKMTFEA